MDLSLYLPRCRLKDVICLETVSSTNTYLKGLADAPSGTVVISETQTGGVGRYKRTFHSPKGGIYLSYLFRDPICGAQYLTPIAGVCVKRAIESLCGVNVGIKWVNDLILGNKKICGILAESVTDGEVSRTILGIGINVNTAKDGFRGDLSDIASSLLIETGKYIDEGALCAEIIKNLDSITADRAGYLQEYRKSCVTVGKDVVFYSQDGTHEGRVLGVDDSFSLEILTKNGEKRSIFSGEVSTKPLQNSEI